MREVKHIKDIPAIISRPDITAKVYSVNPPYHGANYVLISAIDYCDEVETYAFKCDASGEIEDWAELPASQKGIYDIEAIEKKIRNS